MTAMDTMTMQMPARAGRAARPNWAIWVIAAAAYAVELVVSGRYGYQRDELYFLGAGQHLSAGYVDQPPLTRCSPGSSRSPPATLSSGCGR